MHYMIRRIMALHDTHLEHMALSCKVGGGVATGLLKISPDFLSKKKNKKTHKETKFKPPNTSKINA